MAKRKKKIYSESSIGALMEHHNSELEAIREYLENVPKIKKRLDSMDERMERMEDGIGIIKIALKRKIDIEEFEALEKRVVMLERKV